MKSRKLYAKIQGWLGGLFISAGLGFLLITILSAPAVADPIQAADAQVALGAAQASPRATSRQTTGRAGGAIRGAAGVAGAAERPSSKSPRVAQRNANVARTAVSEAVAPAGATQSRAIVRGTAVRTAPFDARQGSTTQQAARNVRNRANASAAGTPRGVVARAGTTQARVGLTGSAIRASRSDGYSVARAGASSSLYPATYTNIVDSSTGMISADAYSNCLQSYYTCMDEVCTARSPGQRRCACAGRVKTFNAVEATLQTAKEDLIKVSGELTMLIATKGESISAAFQLTEAEKSLNCVSYRDAMKNKSQTEQEWCEAHFIQGSGGDWSCGAGMNAECAKMYGGTGSTGWMDILNGADSDILTALNTYASTINEVDTISYADNSNLAWSYNNVASIVGATSNSVLVNGESEVDTLAQTWGYDLYQYTHNNVCGRVLDACFNGIYEACGNRPSAQGGGTGPYNLNSKITVTNNGNEVGFITATASSATGTAACYGYTTSSGDPYSSLRVPVADARVSILQKYVLDANADCDIYGEELKKQAQNMALQKIAATQMLQKKRLEFALEREETAETELATAKETYQKCLDEIQQCRTDLENNSTYAGWTSTRRKSYCNTMSNIPSCYEKMVCDAVTETLIEKDGKDANGNDIKKNVVTLTDILTPSAHDIELKCLSKDGNVSAIRKYGTEDTGSEACIPVNGTDGYKTWDAAQSQWTECQATKCKTGYLLNSMTKKCQLPANSHENSQSAAPGPFNPIAGATCNTGYKVSGGECVAANCPDGATYDMNCLTGSAETLYETDTPGGCVETACRCNSGLYATTGGECESRSP